MTVDRGGGWRDWAACQGYGEDLWTADGDDRLHGHGRSPNSPYVRSRWERAKQICQSCPVKAECLQAALSVPADLDRVGIFGGRTPAERAELRGPSGPRLLGAERHAETELYRGGRAGGDPRRDPQRPRDGDGLKRGQVVGVWLPPPRPVPVHESTSKGFNPSMRLPTSPFLTTPRRPKPAPRSDP